MGAEARPRVELLSLWGPGSFKGALHREPPAQGLLQARQCRGGHGTCAREPSRGGSFRRGVGMLRLLRSRRCMLSARWGSLPGTMPFRRGISTSTSWLSAMTARLASVSRSPNRGLQQARAGRVWGPACECGELGPSPRHARTGSGSRAALRGPCQAVWLWPPLFPSIPARPLGPHKPVPGKENHPRQQQLTSRSAARSESTGPGTACPAQAGRRTGAPRGPRAWRPARRARVPVQPGEPSRTHASGCAPRPALTILCMTMLNRVLGAMRNMILMMMAAENDSPAEGASRGIVSCKAALGGERDEEWWVMGRGMAGERYEESLGNGTRNGWEKTHRLLRHLHSPPNPLPRAPHARQMQQPPLLPHPLTARPEG